MRIMLLLAAVLYFATPVNAQQQNEYPKTFFRNPLNIPVMLAGNFGECRPNHFHSGIDIKTSGKENLPVFAAADGYISRIKMERGGFGHALYVTHKNGFTTLYAHLNDFMPDIQRYMKTEQYKKENWELDLTLTEDKFPVKKGQQIAWSGNTGGSTAPHLHFEIRATSTEHPLNPLLFGFDVKDNIAPKPTQLYVYNADVSIYEQEPQVLSLAKKGERYRILRDTVSVTSLKAGFGVNVNDYMNGSDNTLNYYMADVYADDVKIAGIVLDDIGYDVTRYMHAFVDYKVHKQRKTWVQLMFQLKGNKLNHIYSYEGDTRGILTLKENDVRKVNIVLTDAFGNDANIEFYARYNSVAPTPRTCTKQLFNVNSMNEVNDPNIAFNLDENALYDDVCFGWTKASDATAYSNRYTLHSVNVPIHSYFDLRIKPNKAIPFDAKNKIVMVYTDSKDEDGRAAINDNGWYTAKVRTLGTYRLVTDTQPPTLNTALKDGANLATAKQISFTAKDALTSVKTFRGELDGKWICFERRGNNFFYEFDEHCSKGKHELKVTATDENGNDKTLRFTFVR